MPVPPCSCLKEAELCEACGTWCRWFDIGRGQLARFHLFQHASVPDGSIKSVFHQHSPESCRKARTNALLNLRSRGLLRSDAAR